MNERHAVDEGRDAARESGFTALDPAQHSAESGAGPARRDETRRRHEEVAVRREGQHPRHRHRRVSTHAEARGDRDPQVVARWHPLAEGPRRRDIDEGRRIGEANVWAVFSERRGVIHERCVRGNRRRAADLLRARREKAEQGSVLSAAQA